jgi:hypothetical protein
MLALASSAPGCVTVDIDGLVELLLAGGAVAVPALAVPLLMRIARRHPSRSFATQGRRLGGVTVCRWGIGAAALGLLGIVTALVVGAVDPQPCDSPASALAVASVVLTVLGALTAGGGWAFSLRANWVVLGTLAAVDVWIVYLTVVVGIEILQSVNVLVALAFIIHACCTGVAARWSFNAKDLGPIGRAKAGEAGRTLAGVWVFLAAYSLVAWLRDDNDVFASGAGSAVVGALTVGALAVTMGSGYTKYSEAIHGEPAAASPGPDRQPEQAP